MNRYRVVFVAFVLTSAAVAIAADNPFTGMWRLDRQNTAERTADQLILSPVEGGISIEENGSNVISGIYGQERPYKSTSAAVRIVRVNDHTLTVTLSSEGRVALKEEGVVSEDGLHFTRNLEFVKENPRTGAIESDKTTLEYERIGPVPAGDAFWGTWQQVPGSSPSQVTYALKVDEDTFEWKQNNRRVLTAKFDGKEHREANGNAARIVRRIDDRTIEMTTTSAGSSSFGEDIAPESAANRQIRELWEIKGSILTRTTIMDQAGNQIAGVQRFRRVQ